MDIVAIATTAHVAHVASAYWVPIGGVAKVKSKGVLDLPFYIVLIIQFY